LVLTAFVVGSVLAGANAVGIKFSNDELDPLWGAALRFTAAAAVMWLILAFLRRPVPRGRALTGSLLYGLFNFAGAFGFGFLAFVELEAGFGQLVLAIVPLLTLLLAVAHGQEALRMRSLAGALLAIAGITVMSSVSLAGGSAMALVFALLAAICFAEGAVVVRRFRPIDPYGLNAVGMTVGAVVILGAALVRGDDIALPERAATWLAQAYMILVGSVLVFVLYVFILSRWEASRATYTFVVVPPVTVLVSWWLRDEPLGAGLVLGGVLVLIGVYIGAIQPSRSHVDAGA
jgi:drug/metabolite transporter (DMT)-like permease